MRKVFERIPPRDIVNFYFNNDAKPKQLAQDMVAKFGSGTIKCMQDITHLLAVLWQSAWVMGTSASRVNDNLILPVTEKDAMKICQDASFLKSVPIGKIAQELAKSV